MISALTVTRLDLRFPVAVASGLPLLSMAAALAVNIDGRSWPLGPIPDAGSLLPDASLCSALAVLVLAPLAGVAGASSHAAVRAPTWRSRMAATCVPALFAISMFTLSSALLTWLATPAAAVSSIATSHATMAAVALALAMFGAFCGISFADPLDAVGVGLGSTALAAGGLLAGGRWVALAPSWLVESALVANPLVAMSAAFGIDVVRIDALYRISPLAHMNIVYPAWSAATAWYTLLAFAAAAGVGVKCRTARTAIDNRKDLA
jgi:hypothetical protein